MVERIIQKIIKDNVDIDKLLVVTFTNAAASEMRERVLDAIYKKLDEEPENFNLQKQINLISKANISTIHSFCLEVIRNNFFKIDVSPNFRIGNDEEMILMKQEVLDELFEEKYEEENEKFLKLVDTYCEYRDDDKLQNLVSKIYSFASSAAFPEEWLKEKLEELNIDLSAEKDFSETIWGKIIINELKETTKNVKDCIKAALEITKDEEDLKEWTIGLEKSYENLRELNDLLSSSWDEAYRFYKCRENEKIFPDWSRKKTALIDEKDCAKKIRDKGVDEFKNKFDKYLTCESKVIFRDIKDMYEIIKSLTELVIDFDNKFKETKKEKNIIDFNDIEHYALKILVEKDESGNYIPTDVAKNYSKKFEEIAIDEYQDSNNVQELILTSISRGNNIFTVGDVKQSIYRFRRACPELFLDKYENYSLEGNEKGLKIQLFKNFRSRENILEITNSIFESIMSKKLGEIDYTKEEFLNLGMEYENNENTPKKSEVYVIDNSSDNLDEDYEEDYDDDDEDEDDENEYNKKNEVLEELRDLKKEEIEAKFVCKKIKEIIASKVQIYDKNLKALRPIKFKDIVILMRATKFSNIYEKELLKNNIPVFSDSSSEYLETVEIQTIINLLKILDNSLDDIAVVTVLRSPIFGFTDNEIVEIRLVDRESYFWDTLKKAKEEFENETLKEKLNKFLDKIEEWKEEKDYIPISEFIWKVYVETGFYNYCGLMTNGEIRKANLKMLFERAKEFEKTSFKGLFNFIRFIEKLKSGNSDMTSAKIIGENEDVVRIMSIHKSKGLEFPYVFLCNTSKKMNTEDLKGELLLHKDLGFGPKYLDSEKKLEYPTLAREALKIKLKNEAISEEMRILYVALTRAREKIIITAVRRKESDEIKQKKEDLNIFLDEKKINRNLLKTKNSYLDWIEYVIFNYEVNGKKYDYMDFNIIKSDEIIEGEVEEEKTEKLDFSEYNDFEALEEKLNWKYENEALRDVPIKTTVSNLKEMKSEEVVDFFELNNNELGLQEIIPNFLSEEKITASRIGTIYHLLLQKIDFNKVNSVEDIKEFIEELISKNFIKPEEAKFISAEKVFNFVNSEFALNIKKAKKVYKERTFCLSVPASRIIKESVSSSKVLVQGVIDIYYEKDNGNLCLIDYKTDFVKTDEQELVDKYKVQLELYKEALEKGTNKKVEDVYIYSLYLNKEIRLSLDKI